MLLPWRSSARALFRTSKAVSVPRRDMRRANCNSYWVAFSMRTNSGTGKPQIIRPLRRQPEQSGAEQRGSRVGGRGLEERKGQGVEPRAHCRRISPTRRISPHDQSRSQLGLYPADLLGDAVFFALRAEDAIDGIRSAAAGLVIVANLHFSEQANGQQIQATE